MPVPIIIFHHGLFTLGDPPEILTPAISIAYEQMIVFKDSGLLDAASELHVGINGSREDSEVYVKSIMPDNAQVVYHGAGCRTELRTILMIEKRVKSLKEEAHILYVHQKGSTHPPDDPLRTDWRECFMLHLVFNWRVCVFDLQNGCEAVGCHWMTPPQTPPTQYIFAGNMWWARASFLATLPSVMERSRIKESGIDSLESRYEAEVYLCNGPRLPVVKDYCPGWWVGKPHM